MCLESRFCLWSDLPCGHKAHAHGQAGKHLFEFRAKQSTECNSPLLSSRASYSFVVSLLLTCNEPHERILTHAQRTQSRHSSSIQCVKPSQAIYVWPIHISFTVVCAYFRPIYDLRYAITECLLAELKAIAGCDLPSRW